MRMLSHRLQILLDEGRYRRLAREAERRQASVATVIRGAIDLALPASSHESRQAAVAAILASAPMPVPADPAELRQEVDEARLRPDR